MFLIFIKAESACNADPNLCTSTQLCVDTAPAEFRCDCRVGFIRDLMDNCVGNCLALLFLCKKRKSLEIFHNCNYMFFIQDTISLFDSVRV